MGIEMIEKNSFYTFGRKMNTSNPNGEFRNFIPAIVAGGIVLGRKKKNDKTRQEIADKYQSFRIDCDGIDSSISQVLSDLSSLKSSKPRKNKDERLWRIRIEETDNVLRELQSSKRNLICGKDIATPPTPSSPSSGGGSSIKNDSNVSPNKGGLIDNKGMMADSESPNIPPKSNRGTTNKKMLLYVVLGLAVVGGVIYFIRKK